MIFNWLRSLPVVRSRAALARARRVASAIGAMDEPESESGRDWLDAAVDLNLPELLRSIPAASARRDRRSPAGFNPRFDPRAPGWTLLHEAAYRGHWECAQALFRKGAQPSARDSNGLSPLQALFCFDPARAPNKRDGGCPGPDGMSLSEANASLTAHALLRAGAVLAGGELSRAAFLGWGSVCETLIKAGASARERPDERFAPELIEYCVEAFWDGHRTPKTVERLAAMAPIPLLLALLSGSAAAVSALSASLEDREIENAAAFAAGSNRLDMAVLLLANRPGASPQRALCALARGPAAEDSPAAAGLAAWLVSRGADPRLADPDSSSPYAALEEAARAHKPQLAAALARALDSHALGEAELAFLTRLVEHHAPSGGPASLAANRQSASRAFIEGLSIASGLAPAEPPACPEAKAPARSARRL